MSIDYNNRTITIRTLGPVFIGNGRSVNKKEYIFDRTAGKMYFFDVKKMYDGLCAKKLGDQYEEYLMDGYGDLYGFLKHNQIPEMQYKKWINRAVAVGDPSMNLRSIKEVQEFIKDPSGRPYIPGSSLKGMLRTILQVYELLKNPDEETYSRIRKNVQGEAFENRRRYHARSDAALDQASFHRELFKNKDGLYDLKDQNNDVLRGLYIGDSEPISADDLCVCEKIDMLPNGDMRTLNLLRECIKPFVCVSFPVTIDKTICPYTMNEIMRAMKAFYQYYNDLFADHFSKAPEVKGNSTTFYLGGGAGYVSKTVTYGLISGKAGVKTVSEILDNTVAPNDRRRHDHAGDPDRGVSPHMMKCTKYKNKLYQMGACCLIKI